MLLDQKKTWMMLCILVHTKAAKLTKTWVVKVNIFQINPELDCRRLTCQSHESWVVMTTHDNCNNKSTSNFHTSKFCVWIKDFLAKNIYGTCIPYNNKYYMISQNNQDCDMQVKGRVYCRCDFVYSRAWTTINGPLHFFFHDFQELLWLLNLQQYVPLLSWFIS